ncbi:uncharacterized protein MAM_07173 [Metarhizium album ARSEF 1941]|uniref:Uncharacterized protein n=1 Tax=Metarhizium album (strain ARSEF 1941) TaxID=1081103 RepID=A0A0B2WG33_METAS|nr:uncharacterized protein MAM_07173 [Metarhizium album ARSEF 1941]KHN94946.1 hypothetical protein MAM_07173 [Metarhizium album ARSEF 1941]
MQFAVVLSLIAAASASLLPRAPACPSAKGSACGIVSAIGNSVTFPPKCVSKPRCEGDVSFAGITAHVQIGVNLQLDGRPGWTVSTMASGATGSEMAAARSQLTTAQRSGLTLYIALSPKAMPVAIPSRSHSQVDHQCSLRRAVHLRICAAPRVFLQAPPPIASSQFQ